MTLNTEERDLLRQMFSNDLLMGALLKIAANEEHSEHDRQEQAALVTNPNPYVMVQHAAKAQVWREALRIIKERAKL